MKKNLMGKVTALHFILPVSFFHACDELIKLLRDDIVEEDRM